MVLIPLDRTAQWESWLRILVLVSGALAIAGLFAAPLIRRLGRRAWVGVAAFAVIACLSGPIAYSAQTITTAHTGSTPSAGPSSDSSGGAPGGGGAGAGASTSSALVKALESKAAHYRWVAAVSGSQGAASLELATAGAPVMAIGGFDNEGGNLTLAQFKQYVSRGEIHYYVASSNSGGGGQAPAGSGTRPSGGPPNRSSTAHTTPGGTRPAGGQGGSSSSAITTWVKAHYKTVTVGGQTLYDLTQARA